MADPEWLMRRSREVARELEALPDWERALIHAQLIELGKPRMLPGEDNPPKPADQTRA